MRNKNKSLDYKSKNYKMKDKYKAEDLVVANLEYVSSELLPYGPEIRRTKQKYLFEIINQNGKTRYMEIFTGYRADDSENGYFDFPYVVDIEPLKDRMPSVADEVPKYGLLLVLDEINKKVKKPKK